MSAMHKPSDGAQMIRAVHGSQRLENQTAPAERVCQRLAREDRNFETKRLMHHRVKDSLRVIAVWKDAMLAWPWYSSSAWRF